MIVTKIALTVLVFAGIVFMMTYQPYPHEDDRLELAFALSGLLSVGSLVVAVLGVIWRI